MDILPAMRERARECEWRHMCECLCGRGKPSDGELFSNPSAITLYVCVQGGAGLGQLPQDVEENEKKQWKNSPPASNFSIQTPQVQWSSMKSDPGAFRKLSFGEKKKKLC